MVNLFFCKNLAKINNVYRSKKDEWSYDTYLEYFYFIKYYRLTLKYVNREHATCKSFRFTISSGWTGGGEQIASQADQRSDRVSQIDIKLIRESQGWELGEK